MQGLNSPECTMTRCSGPGNPFLQGPRMIQPHNLSAFETYCSYTFVRDRHKQLGTNTKVCMGSATCKLQPATCNLHGIPGHLVEAAAVHSPPSYLRVNYCTAVALAPNGLMPVQLRDWKGGMQANALFQVSAQDLLPSCTLHSCQTSHLLIMSFSLLDPSDNNPFCRLKDNGSRVHVLEKVIGGE